MTSSSDHKAFIARLQSCIERAGSGQVAVFARKAAMVPNTIRRYLAGSEPTRPMLVSLAVAANVSPEWLAFGSESPARAQEPIDSEEAKNFSVRFNYLVGRFGGVDEFARRFSLDRELVVSLGSGDPPHIRHLSILADDPTIPLRWLLSSETSYGFQTSGRLKTLRDLVNRIESIDDWRLFEKWESGLLDQGWRYEVFDFLVSEYEGIPPSASYKFYKLPSGSAAHASPGDLALVDTASRNPDNGIYLFKEKAIPESIFLRQVARIGGKLRDAAHINEEPSGQMDESTVDCLGRLVVLARMFIK